jgi:hypothetical protein
VFSSMQAYWCREFRVPLTPLITWAWGHPGWIPPWQRCSACAGLAWGTLEQWLLPSGGVQSSKIQASCPAGQGTDFWLTCVPGFTTL